MARGRKKTTGKYESREELIDNVCHFYYMGHNELQVSRITGISDTTARKILDEEYVEWKKNYMSESA